MFVSGNLNGTSFLRKYDLKGAEVWNSQYGSGLSNDATALSAGPSGVYVGGYGFPNGTNRKQHVVIQKYDLDGTPAWTSILGNEGYLGDPPVIDVTSTGVYIASEVSSSGSSHVIVAKYDFNGVSNWTRQLDDSYGYYWSPSGITSDSSGVYVVAEYFIGYNGEALLRKHDSGGNQLWTLQLTPPDYSGIGRVAINANTSGVYLGYATFVEHDFLAKYDGSGNQEWSFQTRGSPRSIFAGANGVYVGGGGAYLAEFSQSSSLILFGVNPPFSFGLVALLVGIIAAAVLLMRRLWKRKYGPRSANMLRFKDIRRDTSSHTRSSFHAEPVLPPPHSNGSTTAPLQEPFGIQFCGR